MDPDTPQRPDDFRIGDWIVKPTLNRLDGPAGRVDLTHKSTRVLCLLAEAGGRVLSRRRLLHEAWPDTVVSEESLTRVICDLRQALGDAPGAPAYIETIRKGGYRLMVPVRPVDGASPVAEEPHRPAWRRPVVPLAAVMILVLAVVAVRLVSSLLEPVDPPLPAMVEHHPLTSHPGQEGLAAISPDGTRVAFCSRASHTARFDIHVKQPGGGPGVRITDTPDNEAYPAWSPDGAELAYVINAEGKTSIWTVPSLGGVPRLIWQDAGRIRGLDWSAATGRMAIGWWPGYGQYVVFELDPADPRPRLLVRPVPFAEGDQRPRYAPGGERVAFQRAHTDGRQSLCIVRVEDGEILAEHDGFGTLAGLDWYPDGRHLAVARGSSSGGGLWKLDGETGNRQRVPLPWNKVAAPACGPATAGMVLEVHDVDLDLVRIDPAAAGEVRPLWTSTRRDRLPARDATTGRVAFCSDRTGGDQVYLADGPDAAPVRITDFQGLRLHSLAFAPTGGRLMFWASRIDAPADDADVLGSSFVGLLDVDDGSWRRLDQPGREVASPLWAADGRSIFVVAMQDEMWACRRVPIDGGGPGRRLLVDYIVPAHHCAATEELLFFRYGHPGLFRLPLGEGDGDRGDLAAAGFPDVDRVRGHAGHGSRLFGLVQESDFTTLIRYDAVAQRTDTLAVLPLAVDSGAFAVADDLSWAVLSTVTRHHRDLMHLSQLP